MQDSFLNISQTLLNNFVGVLFNRCEIAEITLKINCNFYGRKSKLS